MTGSIYLHCDPDGRSLVEVAHGQQLRDGEFPKGPRPEAQTGAQQRETLRYGPVHDTLWFYPKSDRYLWADARSPCCDGYIARCFEFDDNDWTRSPLGRQPHRFGHAKRGDRRGMARVRPDREGQALDVFARGAGPDGRRLQDLLAQEQRSMAKTETLPGRSQGQASPGHIRRHRRP